VGSVTVQIGGLDTAYVQVEAMSFNPQDVTVMPQGVVVWHWASGTHTVTSGVPVVAATRGHAGHR
jgi:plastocyanin